jgi:hypothetical protein
MITILRYVLTFALKALANRRELGRILYLVKVNGGEVRNLGLNEGSLTLVIWAQLPSGLEVEFGEEKGWVFDTHKDTYAERFLDEVQYLLENVPRDRVHCDDMATAMAVAKVYGTFYDES